MVITQLDKYHRLNAHVTGMRHSYVEGVCRWCGIQEFDVEQCSDKECTPMYFEDLNAVRIVERLLTPHQCIEYNRALARAVGAPLGTAETWTWHASAEVRAEALGEVLKLW